MKDATASSLQEAAALVAELTREANSRKGGFRYEDPAAKLATGRRILSSSAALRALALREAMQAYAAVDWEALASSDRGPFALGALIREIVRRHPGLDSEDLAFAAHAWCGYHSHAMAPAVIVGCIERSARSAALSPAARQAVRVLRDKLRSESRTLATKKLCQRLDAAFGRAKPIRLDGRDRWARAMAQELDAMPAEARAAWDNLLSLSASESGARPSKAWLSKAQALVASIGAGELERRLKGWLPRVVAPNTGPSREAAPMRDANATCLRGLVWATTLLPDARLSQTLGDLAVTCYRKLYEVGPYSAKLGNACVYALGAMPSGEAVAQLGRVRLKVKHLAARSLIDKAYHDAAKRRGVSVENVQESSVPTYGLESGGVRREAVGAWQAEIRLVAPNRVQLAWFDDRGRALKTVPARVRQSHAGPLQELRRLARDIRSQLPVQKARIEAMLVSERALTPVEWRKHYLDHPVVGAIARCLIWDLKTKGASTLAACSDGRRIVDVDGHTVRVPGRDAEVRLWHPMTSPPDVVLAWRRWLQAHAVTQPFAQAHRQVYVLTDAERRTRTYSERFAGHLLREHVLAALCRERGWRYKLQIGDAGACPILALPQWGLSVELTLSSTGVLYSDIHEVLSTGRVVFKDSNGKATALARVPKRLFSEVMRDIDLFVSVASIAFDPAWSSDGDEHQDAYWRQRSFGKLDATAEERRRILLEILPALAVADRCGVGERYLTVRGSRRRYKIHMGTGNVLMEPNDQYLCLVPARDPGDPTVALPFEGDPVLTVILSKALLLAADDRIKDRVILRQIGRAPRD